MGDVVELFAPNAFLWADDATTGERRMTATNGASYKCEDGYTMAVTVTDEGILIDLHTDDSGNPASLAMMWEEWVDYLLEHGVR